MLTRLLVLGLLILLNAFFAAAEIALIAVNENKIKLQAEQGDAKAQMLVNLLAEPSRFLATIQIGITLAGFLASAFAAESFAGPLVDLLHTLGVSISAGVLKPVAVVLITVVLAYFTLVLGELVPKRMAMQKAERVARASVRTLTILAYLAAPFVKLLTVSTNFFIRVMGGDPNADEEQVTEEEIKIMVDVGEQKGTIQETEKQFIHNLFAFDDTSIAEIMTHRTNITGLPLELDFEAIVDKTSKAKYTRFPVYQGSLDNIVGILHVKDLLKYINKNGQEDFTLHKVIRKPHFVPECQKADDLLHELQHSHLHMAIVVDEYGGTAGIITIEDLLEELVGNIEDEHDLEVKQYEKIDDNTYIFDGLINLELVEDILGIKLDSSEYDTLSGFLIGQLGRIPTSGENLTLEWEGIAFKIEEVHSHRISKVKSCRSS